MISAVHVPASVRVVQGIVDSTVWLRNILGKAMQCWTAHLAPGSESLAVELQICSVHTVEVQCARAFCRSRAAPPESFYVAVIYIAGIPSAKLPPRAKNYAPVSLGSIP